MNCQNDYSLPEVIEMRMMDCADLQTGIMQNHIAGVQNFISCPMVTIPIYPGAKCQGVYTSTNGGTTQRTTLEFRTNEPPKITTGKAFAVRTPDGMWYLIGSKEKPWPSIEVVDDKGTTHGDPRVKTVKVTFESLATLIPVTIL